MANLNKYNFGNNSGIWNILFRKIIFRSFMKKIDKISEIRIEEVIDKEDNEKFYWVYFVRNGKIEIIGKSSEKPQCYRQIAIYQ